MGEDCDGFSIRFEFMSREGLKQSCGDPTARRRRADRGAGTSGASLNKLLWQVFKLGPFGDFQ